MKTRLLILIIALFVISVYFFMINYDSGLDESDPVTLLEEIVAIDDCENFEPKFDSWNETYGSDENLDVPDELYNTGIRKAVDCTENEI